MVERIRVSGSSVLPATIRRPFFDRFYRIFGVGNEVDTVGGGWPRLRGGTDSMTKLRKIARKCISSASSKPAVCLLSCAHAQIRG